MNLTIILYEPYPNGMACTNRINYYAKGISKSGEQVNIIIPRPTESDVENARNQECSGVNDGVAFEYSCGTTIRPKSFIARRFINAKGILLAANAVISNRDKIDAVMIVTNALLPLLVFSIVTKMVGVKYIQEKSELPFYNKPPHNVIQKSYQFLYKKYVYKLFDGIIVISKPLYDYFSVRIRDNAKLLLVPVLMDPDEFDAVSNHKEGVYITYCGNYTQAQDGLVTIIKAFKSVSEEVDSIKLVLIGKPLRPEVTDEINELIENLGIANKVDRLGYITRPELIRNLVSATALVLAKPTSLQADYCFPSKLAEYLASGVPVVVTKVGVIPEFLTDGENAFLADPDSVESLAEKLLVAINGGAKSRSIGLEGKKLAAEVFDYRKQGERIVRFIGNLDN